MKKSDELRLKTRKMIAKNLIILVALAVVAFVGAFSWFSENTKATANGITAKTEVSDALEFYFMQPSSNNQYDVINTRLAANAEYNVAHPDATQKNTDWHRGNITFDYSDQEFNFMEGLFMSEVTGDGTDFKIPKLLQYDNIAYVDSTQAFEDASANNNYMSFDLYFRSLKSCDVVLKHDSIIEPINKSSIANVQDIDGTNTANEASMKPAAIGAVRMSVLNCGANNKRELIWIPGPNVWYNGKTEHLYTGLSESGEGNYSFSNKGNVYYDSENDQIVFRDEATTQHAYFANPTTRTVISNDASNKVVASTAGNYALGSRDSDDITVVTLSDYDSTNKYYYGHIRVNLWIEGEDAESRLKFINGKFKMNLHFDVASASSGS